jgi:hypothetical protein
MIKAICTSETSVYFNEIFFFYGTSACFRVMASPTFLLHSSLSLAAAFQL